MPTLNVYVKDKATGQGIGNARVLGLTRNQIIDPPTRQTSGDGGANLYYQGPPFDPPVAVTLAVDAPGYAPGSTNDQPILFGSEDVNFTIELDSFRRPFSPAPRDWAGNMCGVRIPGLPPVPGGADDPSLVLSWFYDRYDAVARQVIREVWKRRGFLDVLVSWPDSQQFGKTPKQFQAMCLELIANGFRPCPFLSAKPTSSDDIRDVQGTLANMRLVIPLLLKIVPRVCIGWELSLWLSPEDVQFLIDAIAAEFIAYGCKVYVHFQEGYMSFQVSGDNAVFWNANIGKLTGVLYQKKLAQTDAEFLDSVNDCLERCAGNDGMPATIIDGHGVDFIGLELSAQWQFNGDMTEAQGDALGRLAINAPHRTGPAGEVMVMGSGNGA